MNFYDNYYSSGFNYEGNKKYIDYLLLKLKGVSFEGGNRILDVGCGIGLLGAILREKYNTTVYGIDRSKIAVKKAKEAGVLAKVSNIEKKWPFKNKGFDIVIAQQVIEHLINPDFFVEESKRVLKNGGFLIITTPNLGAWFNRILLLFGFQPFFTEVSTEDKTIGLTFTRFLTKVRNPLGHLRIFTLKALIDLLEFHHFNVVKTTGGSISYLPNFIKPVDKLFSLFPSLSSDLIVVAKKT